MNLFLPFFLPILIFFLVHGWLVYLLSFTFTEHEKIKRKIHHILNKQKKQLIMLTYTVIYLVIHQASGER